MCLCRLDNTWGVVMVKVSLNRLDLVKEVCATGHFQTGEKEFLRHTVWQVFYIIY